MSDRPFPEEEETHTTSAPSGPASVREHAHLLVLDGLNIGQSHRLTRRVTVLGRSSGASLQFADHGVSRRHARITRSGRDFIVEDLGSANGTFVNGTSVERHVLVDGDKVQLGKGTLLRFGFLDDVDEQFTQRFYTAAVRDAVTQTFNKRYLTERLPAELAYARRHTVDLCLMMLDIDHFKQVNDVHGHPAGDALLAGVAKVVQGALRTEDIFARYGGEEFAVVCRGLDGERGRALAERLRALVESHVVIWKETRIAVTVSIGVASWPTAAAESPEALLAAADAALYDAKRNGRNRVALKG